LITLRASTAPGKGDRICERDGQMQGAATKRCWNREDGNEQMAGRRRKGWTPFSGSCLDTDRKSSPHIDGLPVLRIDAAMSRRRRTRSRSSASIASMRQSTSPSRRCLRRSRMRGFRIRRAIERADDGEVMMWRPASASLPPAAPARRRGGRWGHRRRSTAARPATRRTSADLRAGVLPSI